MLTCWHSRVGERESSPHSTTELRIYFPHLLEVWSCFSAHSCSGNYVDGPLGAVGLPCAGHGLQLGRQLAVDQHLAIAIVIRREHAGRKGVTAPVSATGRVINDNFHARAPNSSESVTVSRPAIRNKTAGSPGDQRDPTGEVPVGMKPIDRIYFISPARLMTLTVSVPSFLKRAVER